MRKLFRAPLCVRTLLCVLSLLAGVASAHAQSSNATIVVSASHLTDASNAVISNATISFAPVDNKGNALSYRKGGSGGQTTISAISASVSNGAFSLPLPDTYQTTPQNVCFAVTVTDNVTGNSLLGNGYACVQPSSNLTPPSNGSPGGAGYGWCFTSANTVTGQNQTPTYTTACNFDSYTPNSAAQAVVTAGPAGAQGIPGVQGAQGPPVSFRGAWSASNSYNVGDAVSYSGSSYIATSANSNASPSSSSAWSLLAAAGAPGASAANAIVNNPSVSQIVAQPSGTTLTIQGNLAGQNTNGFYNADAYSAGSGAAAPWGLGGVLADAAAKAPSPFTTGHITLTKQQGNYRFPPLNLGLFTNGTMIHDYRNAGQATLSYNYSDYQTSFGTRNPYDEEAYWTSYVADPLGNSQMPSAVQHQYTLGITAPGWSTGNTQYPQMQGWSGVGLMQFTENIDSQSISSLLGGNITKPSPGDHQTMDFGFATWGGCNFASDECPQGWRDAVYEGTPRTGTIAAITAPSTSTTITETSTNGQPIGQGVGVMLINTNSAKIVHAVVSGRANSNLNPAQNAYAGAILSSTSGATLGGSVLATLAEDITDGAPQGNTCAVTNWSIAAPSGHKATATLTIASSCTLPPVDYNCSVAPPNGDTGWVYLSGFSGSNGTPAPQGLNSAAMCVTGTSSSNNTITGTIYYSGNAVSSTESTGAYQSFLIGRPANYTPVMRNIVISSPVNDPVHGYYSVAGVSFSATASNGSTCDPLFIGDFLPEQSCPTAVSQNSDGTQLVTMPVLFEHVASTYGGAVSVYVSQHGAAGWAYNNDMLTTKVYPQFVLGSFTSTNGGTTPNLLPVTAISHGGYASFVYPGSVSIYPATQILSVANEASNNTLQVMNGGDFAAGDTYSNPVQLDLEYNHTRYDSQIANPYNIHTLWQSLNPAGSVRAEGMQQIDFNTQSGVLDVLGGSPYMSAQPLFEIGEHGGYGNVASYFVSTTPPLGHNGSAPSLFHFGGCWPTNFTGTRGVSLFAVEDYTILDGTSLTWSGCQTNPVSSWSTSAPNAAGYQVVTVTYPATNVAGPGVGQNIIPSGFTASGWPLAQNTQVTVDGVTKLYQAATYSFTFTIYNPSGSASTGNETSAYYVTNSYNMTGSAASSTQLNVDSISTSSLATGAIRMQNGSIWDFSTLSGRNGLGTSATFAGPDGSGISLGWEPFGSSDVNHMFEAGFLYGGPTSGNAANNFVALGHTFNFSGYVTGNQLPCANGSTKTVDIFLAQNAGIGIGDGCNTVAINQIALGTKVTVDEYSGNVVTSGNVQMNGLSVLGNATFSNPVVMLQPLGSPALHITGQPAGNSSANTFEICNNPGTGCYFEIDNVGEGHFFDSAYASYFRANTSVIAPIFQETLTTPSSSSAACTAGQFTDDASYHYVCTATNTWKRVALSSF